MRGPCLLSPVLLFYLFFTYMVSALENQKRHAGAHTSCQLCECALSTSREVPVAQFGKERLES